MTSAEFNTLDLDQRCEAIWEWGFYVSRTKEGETTKVLYALNGFFVEMIFCQENSKILDVVLLDKIDIVKQPGYFLKNDNPFIKAVA
jgi:hypothetical protein